MHATDDLNIPGDLVWKQPLGDLYSCTYRLQALDYPKQDRPSSLEKEGREM